MEVPLALSTAQPVSTDGYLHFHNVRENPMFWNTDSGDLHFFLKDVRLERAMQKPNTTHATDLTEQGAEAMCVLVTSTVHLDLERGSFTYCFMPIVILASAAWCRARYN